MELVFSNLSYFIPAYLFLLLPFLAIFVTMTVLEEAENKKMTINYVLSYIALVILSAFLLSLSIIQQEGGEKQYLIVLHFLAVVPTASGLFATITKNNWLTGIDFRKLHKYYLLALNNLSVLALICSLAYRYFVIKA